MVLEQGWATPALQEEEEEDELLTAPLDITNEIGSDFELLPEAEVRYTYQDLTLSTEQLHQWSDTDHYANTVGARDIQEPAKARNDGNRKLRKITQLSSHPRMPEHGQAG